jgi:hypothetical protein
MRWSDIRKAYPDQWLVIEAIEAHTDRRRRIVDRIAIVDVCSDGATAFARYRALHRDHPERELYFAHTRNAELEITEERWFGIRRNDAAHSPR